MRKILCIAILVVAISLALMSAAGAASVTYSLTTSSDDAGHISNTGFTFDLLQDGTEYATVKIDDEGTPGLINFTVSLSSFWTGNEGAAGKWGIQSFGFNAVDDNLTAADPSAEIINIVPAGSPGAWAGSVDYAGQNQNGYGAFDVVVDYSGAQQANNRALELTFSIQDDGDTIASYFDGSIPGLNGSHFFAVHIAGFADQNPLDPYLPGDPGYDPSYGECDLNGADPAINKNCNLLVSAWFAGPATVVPVPAAAWLFGSALGGLGLMRRRKKA